MTTALAVLALLAVVAWYLSSSAARLDRLHQRVEGARAALEAQLVRRAGVATELAISGLLDPASALIVAGAAADALAASAEYANPQTGPDAPAGLGPSGPDRETCESDLSRALQVALAADDVVDALLVDPHGRPLVDALASACQRVQLARRFHNDAVTQTLRVRRKLVVRWARLAGYAELPSTVEMDDDPPARLRR